MGFVEKIFRRAIQSNEPLVKSTALVNNIQQCCYQCGVNHEARDFLRATSIYLIDQLQNSKPYVEFLKKNELLTEAAYQHALSNIEEVTKGELRKMKMEMDKVEVTLNTIEKERVLEQKNI
jgi:hypothetical protein